MKKYFDAQIKLYLLWLDLLIEVHPWIQSYLLWLDSGIGWESVHGVYFGLRRPPASFYREQCRSLLCCIKFYRGPNNFIVSLPNQVVLVLLSCTARDTCHEIPPLWWTHALVLREDGVMRALKYLPYVASRCEPVHVAWPTSRSAQPNSSLVQAQLSLIYIYSKIRTLLFRAPS